MKGYYNVRVVTSENGKVEIPWAHRLRKGKGGGGTWVKVSPGGIRTAIQRAERDGKLTIGSI